MQIVLNLFIGDLWPYFTIDVTQAQNPIPNVFHNELVYPRRLVQQRQALEIEPASVTHIVSLILLVYF